MYAICNVVYGIPLNTNETDADEPERSAELDGLIEGEGAGVIGLYSGGGDVSPLAFGVMLSTFDEACHHVELEGRGAPKLAPSAAQVKAFDRLFAALPKAVQREMTKLYGKPRAFLLWSTS